LIIGPFHQNWFYYNQFIKKFKNYRQNPTANLIDKILDQRASNGTMMSSTEIIRELNQMATEKLAKDNNLIEIDLLK